MVKKIQRVPGKIIQNIAVRNETFERLHYEELRYWKVTFTSCTWKDCRFSRISFARGTTFSKCRFEKCRFWRQHTYLGGPAIFEDCEFQDCSLVNIQLWQAEFVRCRFSGSFENLVFYGPEAPDDWRTALRDVDFTGVAMKLVAFRQGIDLSTTRLPPTGWVID